MNLFLLYLLLLKATMTSFSGLTSLPMVRHDLVERHKVLTDRQLNAAVAAGRTAPGPNGLYLVSVGYFVEGTLGACIGCLAVLTPACLIIPMLRYLGRRVERSAVRNAIEAVTLAAAGLTLSATVPLARDALNGTVSIVIAVASFCFLVLTRKATIWVIVASALVSLATNGVAVSRHAESRGAIIRDVARGWESKSVAEQIEAASGASRKPRKPEAAPVQMEQLRKREGLLLSRTRVLRELEKTQNPRYQKLLEKSLAALDAQLRQLT